MKITISFFFHELPAFVSLQILVALDLNIFLKLLQPQVLVIVIPLTTGERVQCCPNVTVRSLLFANGLLHKNVCYAEVHLTYCATTAVTTQSTDYL